MARIYKITNTLNNKIYIGCTVKTLKGRWSEHMSRAKSGKYNNKLYNSMNKYGFDNFLIEDIIECEECDMFNLEVKYISELDSYNLGLNTTTGGEGCLGYKHTQENLDKMSGENSNSFKLRKDKTYEEIYGGEENALLESEKRSEGVRKAWENTSEEDKEKRSLAITKTALEKLGYTAEFVVELRRLHDSGLKPKKILEKYPEIQPKQLTNLLDKRRWNNLNKLIENDRD